MFDNDDADNKVQALIADVTKLKPRTDEALNTKYSKPDMLGAVKILLNDNKELLDKLNEAHLRSSPRLS